MQIIVGAFLFAMKITCVVVLIFWPHSFYHYSKNVYHFWLSTTGIWPDTKHPVHSKWLCPSELNQKWVIYPSGHIAFALHGVNLQYAKPPFIEQLFLP